MAEDIGLGNELYQISQDAIFSLFTQGEIAQLSHSAFDHIATVFRDGEDETITLKLPVGYKPSREPILSDHHYDKDEIVDKYRYLAFTQMPRNGIYQLAIIVEALLTDLIRTIVLRYPAKLGSKRQMPVQKVVAANSLQELHVLAADGLINDLTYKSPTDFAIALRAILGVNVLECPAYHRYIEMKATRDILIHNSGIANETYVAKSGSHARVEVGKQVLVDQVYFLEVYEACLQFVEWLEARLHEIWHSSEYVERVSETKNKT